MNESNPVPDQADLVAKAAAMSIEDLYANIGQLSSRNVAPPSRSELQRMGRLWISDHWEELRQLVCPHREVVSDSGDAAATAATLIPFLGSLAPGAAGVLVAMVVAKIGVTHMCKEADSSEHTE